MINHSTVEGIGKRERPAGVGIEITPSFTAVATGYEKIHAFFPSLITQIIVRPKGVELVGEDTAEVVRKLLHRGNISSEFITQGKHDE